MNALLSINPKFVDEMRKGNKKFEFRKHAFKRNDVEKVIIYETSPVSKIVGEFSITKILKDTPDKIWDITHNLSGISKEFYCQYFEGREVAFAIAFDKYVEYEQSKYLSDYGVKRAPQSFIYID